MRIVRAVVAAGVVVFCAGFVPVSGCAKGCGAAGRSADDFARTGVSYSDDLARSGTRYSGTYTPPRGAAVGVPVGGMGHVGDDFAHLTASNLDNAVATLPEVEGAAASLARRPTSSGLAIDGVDDSARSFGRDYARSIDDLKLTPKQHDEVVDAFESAQDVAKEAVGQLVEAVADSDEDDPEPPPALTREARLKLQLVSLELEARLAETLTPQQQKAFRRLLGTPEVVAYRLGKEQPIHRKRDRKQGSASQTPKQ